MQPLHLYLHTYSLRFHFQHVPDFDVFTFIDLAAANNFTGVSISANDPGYRHLGGTTADWFKKVQDRIQTHNLLCDVDTSGTAPDHLKTLLDVACAVGAQQIRTYTRHLGTPEEMVAQTTEDLITAAPLAKAAGIRIMLENHEEFTGTEIARILEHVNSPWIRALYDYGNSMMVLEDPIEALDAMVPYASAAHLKDHVMISPEDSPDAQLSILGVPIGKGNLPILEITRRLLESGLNRITFENVWAYRAPVKTDRNPPQPNTGIFALARPPFNEHICLLNPENLADRDPQRLIELEYSAFETGLAWLHKHLQEAGIVLAKSQAVD